MTQAASPPGAARKYDILSVLGAHGLAAGKAAQRLALRLICLITARYNWHADELSVGQAEIARLWSVDLRTVKREMAALRARGWLVEKRAAARGRVTLHGLGVEKILADTRADWARVGPDLVMRLSGPESGMRSDPSPDPIAPASNVVAFAPPRAANTTATEHALWDAARDILQTEQRTAFAAWIAGLRFERAEASLVALRAPSAFHASYVMTHFGAAILGALRRLEPGVTTLRVS